MSITDLTANCEFNKAVLQWRIANPESISFLQVAKSPNSKDWEKASAPIDVMTDAVYLYSFKDPKPAYHFYRLETIGRDGEINYSPIQSLNCAETNQTFRLLQNPVVAEARIEIISNASLQATVQIYDLQGRLMLTKPWDITLGYSSLNIDVNHLGSGMYHLRISNNQELLWNAKFVKQ